MIISTVAFVNVKGGVSLDMFKPLEPLLHLSDIVKLESIEDKELLSSILPKTVCLFRDFKHIIIDQGKPIAGHSYLDNFLFDDSKFEKATPQIQKVRKRYAKYFRFRDGFSMVYPLEKRQDIRGLNSLEFQELQEEFQDEIRQLRKNTVYSARKKEF